MTTPALKGGVAAADAMAMGTTRSAGKPSSRLTAVPVPVWVIGATSWVLMLRRVVAELFG